MDTHPLPPRARCTAVTAVLLGERLLVANVGDSRAVLARGGKGAARGSGRRQRGSRASLDAWLWARLPWQGVLHSCPLTVHPLVCCVAQPWRIFVTFRGQPCP
jgi:hypothetical protein